jgi:hypothetical protein
MEYTRLIHAGFCHHCVGAPPEVRDFVQTVRAYPKLLDRESCLPLSSRELIMQFAFPTTGITCYSLEILSREYASRTAGERDPADVDKNHAESSGTDALSEKPNSISYDTNIVAPNLISEYESNLYYRGLSGDPPKLMWRSDFESNPFPMRKPGEHSCQLTSKIACPVFDKHFRQVWHDIAPQILDLFKARGLKWSALHPVCFQTCNEEGEPGTRGPNTVWIAVPPNTTSAAAVREMTPDIVQILEAAEVHGAVVEWYEATVRRL